MAEIGVRLTGDNADFRSMLDRSVQSGAEFAGKLTNKVGGELASLGKMSNALGTALGLNLQSIAENIARTFTGMSKNEEEAYKKLDELGTAVADANIKNMRALLTEEQRYQLTLQERDKLQARIANTTAVTAEQQVKLKQDELMLASKIAEIQAVEAKAAAERQKEYEAGVKVRMAAAEKQFEADLASLTTQQKISVLKDTIAAQTAVIASGALSEKNAAEQTAQLEQRKSLLITEQTNLKKEQLELEKRNRLSKEEELELYLLQKKAALGLTDAERERRDVLLLQSKEKKTQNELDDLLEKGVKNLTPKERERLEELVKQKLEIDKQQAAKQKLITTAAEQKAAEASVTEELEAQARAAAEAARQKDLAARNIVSVNGAPDYNSMSTAALKGEAARQQQKVLDEQRRPTTDFGIAGSDNNYAAVVGANMANYELSKIRQILADREKVSSAVARGGEDYARSVYGDSLTNSALRDVRDAGTRTAIGVEEVLRKLNKLL